MTRDASRSRRLPALATLTSLTAVVLSGCSWMSPVQTDHPQAPADGVDAQLGKVKVTNLLLVASAKDAPGKLVGQATNEGDEDVQLTVGGTSGSTVEKIPAHGSVILGDANITIPSVPAPPGAMTNVTLSTPSSGENPILVPVLEPSGPYATVTPGAGGTDAATPSDSASSTPSAG